MRVKSQEKEFKIKYMSYGDYFDRIPEMETERFILTAFSRDKMDEYFNILRDDEVHKYLGGAVALFDKEPHITNWLRNINDRLLKRKLVFTWCVIEKESGKVIGRIDLGGFIKKTVAEISYHFARSSWGRGAATEVVGKVTDFGMKELKLKRIQGLVRVDNISSIRVLEMNGYEKEGVLRYYPFGREFHNVVMMSMIGGGL